MPACSSSPIAVFAQRLAVPAVLAPDQWRRLLDSLAQLADPRQRRGRRQMLGAVLAVAVATVLVGARSLAAIGEWAADAPGPVLAALGVRRHPLTSPWRSPAEAAVRRVLACVDPDTLDHAIGAWLAAQPQQPPGRRANLAGPAGGRGRRHDPARQRPPPQPAGPSARRDGSHQPRGPRPSRGGGHHRRDRPVPAAAGGVGPRRHRSPPTTCTPNASTPSGWPLPPTPPTCSW